MFVCANPCIPCILPCLLSDCVHANTYFCKRIWLHNGLFFQQYSVIQDLFAATNQKEADGGSKDLSCNIERTKFDQGDHSRCHAWLDCRWFLEDASLEWAEENQGLLWYAGERWDQCRSRGIGSRFILFPFPYGRPFFCYLELSFENLSCKCAVLLLHERNKPSVYWNLRTALLC